MKVLVVEPLKECYAKEIGGLEEMQALVGGYIQAVYPFEDPVAVVCNEEGKNLWHLFCGRPGCGGLCLPDGRAGPEIQGHIRQRHGHIGAEKREKHTPKEDHP